MAVQLRKDLQTAGSSSVPSHGDQSNTTDGTVIASGCSDGSGAFEGLAQLNSMPSHGNQCKTQQPQSLRPNRLILHCWQLRKDLHSAGFSKRA